ncbi:MAG: fumarylacetoacetate hydrolase family protein [Rhodospirillaceae bacterium]|nr:fumarylacetoacetate hydrolase family protein [Rhodospirillaceae bacterium]
MSGAAGIGLDEAAVERAAALLVDARRRGATIPAVPAEVRPATVDDGYRIQDEVARRLGQPVVGWKIGCTAEDQQRFLGADGPFAGRIFAPMAFGSPASLEGRRFHMRGIEAEFAFRLGRDLPAGGAPYDRAAVADAVVGVHPTIEIVNTRYDDWLKVGVPSLIADNAAHGAFVCGPAAADWRGLDLVNHRVTLWIDGREAASGTGARVLGDPLTALVWLANDRARRGDGLEAGQIVTTGTCVGFNPVGPAAEIVADHGALGRVVLRFVG